MVNPLRIFPLNTYPPQNGCVLYWMQRDQRVQDNWALSYAMEQAVMLQQAVQVVFCLSPGYLGATIRQYGFMLKGLQEVEERLFKIGVPFEVVLGEPEQTLPVYIKKVKAGVLVTDFNPLKINLEWREMVKTSIDIPFVEVDAHNILPCRVISEKLEYSAFTFRRKAEKRFEEFLTEFPEPVKGLPPNLPDKLIPTDWEGIKKSLLADHHVPEVGWIVPGETAARKALTGFIENRLETYATDRNFPERKGQSDLSPWLHFGHLSPQRVALEIQKSTAGAGSKKAFMEELIIRRELADNFCLNNPDYDNTHGFYSWAWNSLNKHRDDSREYCYSVDQFEKARTHDPLWNAAQIEMTVTGKMHGFMRMYWAKKILEWTASPEEAMTVAIYLNDKYELDGRDPCGYAGIAWSIGGTHDRPWSERPVFGMIRYMNYQGCKRKFDVEEYIRLTKDELRKT
jgi:deoxyribodipyrimidine photo-lyase